MKTGLRAAALVSLSLLLAAPLAGCGDKQDAGSAAAGEYGTVSASTGTRAKTEAESLYGVLYNGEPYTLRVDLNTRCPRRTPPPPHAKKARPR